MTKKAMMMFPPHEFEVYPVFPDIPQMGRRFILFVDLIIAICFFRSRFSRISSQMRLVEKSDLPGEAFIPEPYNQIQHILR